MPTHTSDIKHRLGREEAMSRLKLHAAFKQGYSDLKGSWEDNVFTFSLSLQGLAVRGRIQVEEDHLRLESEMPAHAPMFTTWLPEMARKALIPPPVDFGESADPVPRPVARSADMDGPPTVLFLHIPKAGGHTLNEYIIHQCSVGEHHDAGGMFNAGILSLQYGFFKDADLSVPRYIRPLLRRADLRAVSGHLTFGLHQHVTRPWTYITVLRDPVDRVVSMYYFVQLHGKMSLEEFVANPPFKEIDNDQVRRIAGVDPELGGLTRETLETAKENLLRHFAVMGTIERFEETLVLLNRKLGWTKEIPTMQRNVTEGRKAVTSLPASIVEAIRGWNELDYELYRFVGEWMDEAIAKEGPAFQAELERRRTLTPTARV